MKRLLAACLLFTSLSARADIIYEWAGNHDAPPFDIALQLVFTDTAFDDGAVDLVMNGGTGRPQPAQPGSELLGLFYLLPGLGIRERIEFQPATTGLSPDAVLRLHFTQDAGGNLAGSLFANNTRVQLGMEGLDGLFTVTSANSDLGMGPAGCPAMGDCHGATGRFLRLSSMPDHAPDNELPEPVTLGLLVLGLLGMRVARRDATRR